MQFAFQDTENLYLVMDLLTGGDLRYHVSKYKKFTEEQPLMKRMALHAYSLEFKLMNGESRVFTAPYPKDFQALVRQLEQNLR